MTTVVLSGATDLLGRRAAAALTGAGATVVDVDETARGSVAGAGVEGAQAAVLLGGDVDETAALLDAAGAVGVRHVVVLSSATAYGAWPDNPVPLTEDAILRPNPDLDFAVRAAERERLVASWKAAHPGTTATVLRPAVPVAEDANGWLARGLRSARAVRRVATEDPPAQYVHLDDVASAIALATTEELDGAYNVAPDHWIDGDRVRALAGAPGIPVPEVVVERVTPAGIRTLLRHPWVVANDKLKAAGWTPAYSNEEAFVAGHRPTPWSTLSPQRRQEVILGASVAAIAATATGVVWSVVKLVRRRRNNS